MVGIIKIFRGEAVAQGPHAGLVRKNKRRGAGPYCASFGGGDPRGGSDQRGGEMGTVWVKNDYITAQAPDSEPETYVVKGNGRVNVRSVPDGERVRWAEVGEVVAVYGWAGEWAIVDGGFIDGSFLSEAKDD